MGGGGGRGLYENSQPPLKADMYVILLPLNPTDASWYCYLHEANIADYLSFCHLMYFK